MFFGLEITLGAIILGAAATVVPMVMAKQSAKKAESRSRKAGQASAEEQAKAAARARAVQNAPISAEQMQKVIKQRELGSLVDHYIEQEGRGPQVHTLPTAQPSSAVVRINNAIHDFITGAA
jgi:hypothetical protein